MIVLGIIIGLLVAILVMSTLTFFRAGIEQRVKIIETRIAEAGPRPQGAVFIPPTVEEEARQEIIDRNTAEGRSTSLEELIA